MAEVLIVESVSKRFKIHRNRPVTLKEFIIRGLKGRNDNRTTTLWALRDVSFSVGQGRTLGIIGHNGAGKSTLLRLVSGLGQPTTGKIRRVGHVGSLLELGSGFNPEMSGRENLITGGILSGLTRRQVKASQDEIISFAELEEFIDQPVRTYSTGMYLRLGFATAIHFDPDFLVIDEALAVGDARFQQKCMDRLKAFRNAGKSLIFASHSLDQVRILCDEVIVLEEGQIIMRSDPESAINCYYDLINRRTEKRAAQLGQAVDPNVVADQGRRRGTQEASITAVQFYNAQGKAVDSLYSEESLTIELEYRLYKPLADMAVLLHIYNETNVKCFETVIPSVYEAFGSMTEKGRFRCHLPELPLIGGTYYIKFGLYPTDWAFVYDYHGNMHQLNVMNRIGAPSKISGNISGVVWVRPTWSIELQD